MSLQKTHAVMIAEVITESSIPGTSPMHEAMRRAQIQENARLIEAFANIAGISLDDVAARIAPEPVAEEIEEEACEAA